MDSKAKDIFFTRHFPPYIRFYMKDNLNISSLAGFSCNQKAKAKEDSSWRADVCYSESALLQPQNTSPIQELIGSQHNSCSCAVACFQQETLLTMQMAVICTSLGN